VDASFLSFTGAFPPRHKLLSLYSFVHFERWIWYRKSLLNCVYILPTQPQSIQTCGALYAFLVAMMLYPEVQEKAQAELDSVVDSDRLPTLEDRSQLPYIMALVKEVLRWSPPSGLGEDETFVDVATFVLTT
jgi:hypothetical protein